MRPDTYWTRARYRLRRWGWHAMLTGWAVLEIVGVIGLSLVVCLLLALACWVAAAVLLGRALWERATRPRAVAVAGCELVAVIHEHHIRERHCLWVEGKSPRQIADALTRDRRFYAEVSRLT